MTPSSVPRRRSRLGAPAALLALVVLASASVSVSASTAGAAAGEGSQDGRVLRVGSDRALARPSEAAAIARDGDRVLIDAGTYRGDVATWTADDLEITGVGGLVRLPAAGRDAQGKGTWVIAGDRVVVRRVAFSGARVADRNGAGIRAEGTGLRVIGCRFTGNENGILAGARTGSRIVVRDSVFRRNGHGDGQSHQLYVGEVASLVVQGSLFVGARGGHAVKSRALRTRLVANRILDGDAAASYLVDLPDGGGAHLSGNVLRQGPNAVNRTLVSYAAESQDHAAQRLVLGFNTLLNDQSSGVFVRAAGRPGIVLRNNLLVGPGDLVSSAGARVSSRGDVRLAAPRGFADADTGDLRLLPGSPAADRAVAVRRQLQPPRQPSLSIGTRPRRDHGDVGAYALLD